MSGVKLFVRSILLHWSLVSPTEGSLASVISVLQTFGDMKSVDHQQWVGHIIKTGTLGVRFIGDSTHIPRFLVMDVIPCKVWYREQPLRCDIYSEPHKVAPCAMLGKCMKGHKEGHVHRECPNLWLSTSAPSLLGLADPVNPTLAGASTHDIEESSNSSEASDDESEQSVELVLKCSPPTDRVNQAGSNNLKVVCRSRSLQVGSILACSSGCVPLKRKTT